MLQLLAQFVGLSTVIVIAGIALTRLADSLSESLGLNKSLGGLLLLALATSLPELAVDMRAAATAAIDLAVGSTIGSSLYNLLVLALLDLGRKPHGRILSPLAAAHGLSATASIVLVGITSLFIVAPISMGLGRVGLGTIATAFAYLFFLRLIFFDQQYAAMTDITRAASTGDANTEASPQWGLRWIVIAYLSATLLVFFSAVLLVPVAGALADRSGLGQTFVGTAFVALASSLPEVVTTTTAVRLGFISLAVGNIFGSNAFNMVILLPADAIYSGNLLADASPVHAVTGLCVVVVTAVCIAGLLYRPDRKVGLEPDAKAIIGLILLSFLLIYYLR